MLFLVKSLFIGIICLLITLSVTLNTLRMALVFEILWVLGFSLCIFLNLLVQDPLFIALGLFTFVLSAAEIILLLSMSYFKA